MWLRVFSIKEEAPAPAALLAHLQAQGFSVRGDFGGDDLGWFRGDLRLEGDDEPIHVQRYLATEEDLRDELNTWAAWLETMEHKPYARRLMQHMISSAQVFTFQAAPDLDDDDAALQLCLAACRYLAQETQGVYQVDNRGFYAPNATLLVAE
jgi:hypothetical protein